MEIANVSYSDRTGICQIRKSGEIDRANMLVVTSDLDCLEITNQFWEENFDSPYALLDLQNTLLNGREAAV